MTARPSRAKAIGRTRSAVSANGIFTPNTIAAITSR
jgi:hypothetical protein